MGDYARTIQPAVEAALYEGKVVVIYGARQVGKTTSCAGRSCATTLKMPSISTATSLTSAPR